MRLLTLVVSLLVLTSTAAPAQPVAGEGRMLTEHFAISYSTDPSDTDAPDLSDDDGDGVPDAIARLAAALEAAYDFEVGELGFPPPPGEGPYEVYVVEGDAVPHVRIVPSDEGVSRESFMIVPPHQIRSVVPQDFLEQLMAHEFFHGIQYGYDHTEADWFLEASATVMEQLMHPDAGARYWTLPYFLTTLDRGLYPTVGPREYGAFLFLRYLEESDALDGTLPQVFQQVLEAAAPAEVTVETALNDLLVGNGSDLDAAWAGFVLWSRQLWRFADGDRYREALAGSGWLRAPRRKVTGESCRLDLGDAPLFSAVSERVRLEDDEGGLVTLTAPPGARLLLLPKGSEPIEVEVDPDGAATVELGPEMTAGRLVVVAIVAGIAGDIAYSVRPDGAPPVTAAGPPTGDPEVRYGVTTTLRGSVTCAGEPAGNARVLLIATAADGSGYSVGLTTDDDGRWDTAVTPEMNTNYTVELVDPLLSAAGSSALPVTVEQFVTIDAVAAPERSLEVSGTVTPHVEGATLGIEYRRPEAARWRSGPSTLVSEEGSYELATQLPAAGIWEVRTVLLNDLDPYRRSGRSVIKVVKAKA